MKKLFVALFLTGFLFSATGCNNENSTEEAADEVENNLEEAAEDTEESLEGAGEDIEESVDAAEDSINVE